MEYPDKQRNGLEWPEDPVEKHILWRLQQKAEHGYGWPEWAVAYEAAQAAKEYFAEGLELAWQYRELTD